jgi:hypothetical protein
MSEIISSTGVQFRENDISVVEEVNGPIGAAIIGPTAKGPVEVPTKVTSYGDYLRTFGSTFESGSTKYEYLTSIAVKDYFSQGGPSVIVSRVVSGSSSWTSADSSNIKANITVGDVYATGSGVVVNAATHGQEFKVVTSDTNYRFIASEAPIPSDNPAGNLYFFATGSDESITVSNLVSEINAIATLPVTASAVGNSLTLSGSAAGTLHNGVIFTTSSVVDSSISSSLIVLGGGLNTFDTQYPFTLSTIGKGNLYNIGTGSEDTGGEFSDGSLISGSEDNLRWEVSNINSAIGTFTLAVRRGDDNSKSKIIIETFNNLSLDPNSNNYIEKQIGTEYKAIAVDGPDKYLRTYGNYKNKSKYIRVSGVNLRTLNYLATDGVTVNVDTNGVTFSNYLPTIQSGSFYSGVGSNIPVGEGKYYGDINSSNTQGIEPIEYADSIAVLSNRDDFEFNMISAPGLVRTITGHAAYVDSIISLAETRGDCIAIVDLAAYNSATANVVSSATSVNSSYASTYWPWVQVENTIGQLVWVPASTVIPGVYGRTDNVSQPWYAPAGLDRGVLPGIIKVEQKLTARQRGVLYASNINPIATFPGLGMSVAGQKTLLKRATALDRIGVRRLLIELKRFFGIEARKLVFEQNVLSTRNKFLAKANPYMERVQQGNGLYYFAIKMDETINTGDVIDRNELLGKVEIKPTRTAELVTFDFIIEPTGATVTF